MKKGWEYKKFESCLAKVPKQVQVKSKDYKKTGRFPIVSQESELISGYWDDETIVYKHNEPVIIFGDHTKNIKYIDFDFVVGADGTHILSTKDDIIAKYFFYALKSVKLRNLGYARHYKLLKEKYIPVPPLSEQQSIIDYLDSAFAKIDAMKANAEKALNEAKALFQASLKEMLEPKEGWEEKKLSDIYDVRDGTHDSPKYHETGYPLVTSKNLRGGILDMSNVSFISAEDYNAINNRSKVDIGDVLFAMIGTIGNPVYVQEKPNYAIKNMALFKVPSYQSGEFLRYYLLNDNVLLKMQIESKGTTQKFVSLGYLRNFLIKIPNLSTQQSIVATLDSLKSKVDRLQANYDKISQECDALKQAILRQVFE